MSSWRSSVPTRTSPNSLHDDLLSIHYNLLLWLELAIAPPTSAGNKYHMKFHLNCHLIANFLKSYVFLDKVPN